MTLKDIVNEFPLKNGKYHFRFQTLVPNTAIPLWIDIINEDISLPMYNGKKAISLKFLRHFFNKSTSPSKRLPKKNKKTRNSSKTVLTLQKSTNPRFKNARSPKPKTKRFKNLAFTLTRAYSRKKERKIHSSNNSPFPKSKLSSPKYTPHPHPSKNPLKNPYPVFGYK